MHLEIVPDEIARLRKGALHLRLIYSGSPK